MPQLDLTYALSQSCVCMVTFLLIYFTIGKQFFFRYSAIFKQRQSIVDTYLTQISSCSKKSRDLKKKLEISRNNFLAIVKKQELAFDQRMSSLKGRKLESLQQKIKDANTIHYKQLSQLKLETCIYLQQHSSEIKKIIMDL